MPTPGFKQVDKGGPVVYDIAGDGSLGYCYGVGVISSPTTGGAVATGAAATGNPVLVGLRDVSGNAQFIAGDASGNQFVTGNVAAGVADAGNPLKVGGKASSGAPSAVTTLQRVDAWFGLNGGQVVFPGSADAGLDSIAVRNSRDPAGTVVLPTVHTYLWNGANADRQRNNTDLTLLASAAHTTAQQSADQVNYNGHGVRVVLNVTVASGTGGLQVQIQGKDSISASYYQLNTTPTLVTATGTYVYDLYPSTLDAAANGITQKTQTFLPRTWRVNVAVGDASSYTYSISGVTML